MFSSQRKYFFFCVNCVKMDDFAFSGNFCYFVFAPTSFEYDSAIYIFLSYFSNFSENSFEKPR